MKNAEFKHLNSVGQGQLAELLQVSHMNDFHYGTKQAMGNLEQCPQDCADMEKVLERFEFNSGKNHEFKLISNPSHKDI